MKHWPKERIRLRQETRIVEDSRDDVFTRHYIKGAFVVTGNDIEALNVEVRKHDENQSPRGDPRQQQYLC